jgi:hypothetical protein
MFPHRNFHEYTRTHNQVDHMLKDMWWHSSILELRSVKEDECDIDHYLAIGEVRERLVLSEPVIEKFDARDLTLRNRASYI